MTEDVLEYLDQLRAQQPDLAKDDLYAKAWHRFEDPQSRYELAKAAPEGSARSVEFEVETTGAVGSLFKSDDDYLIWGPASVEVVDKERDRITAEALEKGLPQLLKRARLSYEHQDQIVGEILEKISLDEEVTVEIDGNEFTRSEFPTDVLDLEGMDPALYVGGNVYNDTQKSQEVREGIDDEQIDSYSISGEAVVSEMAVKNGRTFTDITKIDLSAVTLCSQGMNQEAKFGVVQKDDNGDHLTPQRAAALAKSELDTRIMGSNNDDDQTEKFKSALGEVLDDRLPSGDIATKSDVKEMVKEEVEKETYSGDNENTTDEVMTEPSDEQDSTLDEQTQTSVEADADDRHKAGTDPGSAMREFNRDPEDRTGADGGDEEKAFSKDELKSMLPDDQFKAIEPLLEEEGGEEVPGGPDEGPDDEEGLGAPDEGPDEEPDMTQEKSLNEVWDDLSPDQQKAVAKSGALAKTGSSVGTPTSKSADEPAYHGQEPIEEGDDIAKADNETIASDPAMRDYYTEDGEVKL